MKRFGFLIGICAFSCYFALFPARSHAYEHSSEMSLHADPADSLRILDSLVNLTKVTNNDQSIRYAVKALTIARRMNSVEELVDAYKLMGIAYNQTQKEDDDEKLTSFRAASYQAYQGEKLVKRFSPHSYWCLTCLSDTHNIGRGRGGIINALQTIKAKVLCVGIKSDMLFPTDDQKFITSNTKGAEYIEIDSFYGHDGFLIETDIVTDLIRKFWEKTSS